VVRRSLPRIAARQATYSHASPFRGNDLIDRTVGDWHAPDVGARRFTRTGASPKAIGHVKTMRGKSSETYDHVALLVFDLAVGLASWSKVTGE
jgi:hypothetical protein